MWFLRLRRGISRLIKRQELSLICPNVVIDALRNVDVLSVPLSGRGYFVGGFLGTKHYWRLL